MRIRSLLAVIAFGLLASPALAEPLEIVAAGPASDQMPTVTGFTDVGTGEPSPEETEVRVRYDEHWIYVEIHAIDKSMWEVTSNVLERDGPVWEDDSVEVFLDPGKSGSDYWHIMINPVGTVFDEYVSGGARDAKRNLEDLRATIVFQEDRWITSLYIPMDEVARGIAPEGEWGINFTRNIATPKGIVYTTWQPIEAGTFHAPEEFAHLKFGE